MAKETETVSLIDVHVKTKIPKKTKAGKDFWIIETNKGSIMCFDASMASKVNPSDTMAYDLSAEPPADGYKAYILKGVMKTYEHQPSAAPAAPAQVAQAPAGGYKAYRAPGAAMGRDMDTDIRISKLAIFGHIAQIQAAKIRVTADMANSSTAAIVCETIDLTKAVLTELMYPEMQPVVSAAQQPAAPAAPASQQGIPDDPPFKQPAQPAAQPVAQPAVAGAPMPPPTPRPAAAPAQAPYNPPPAVQVPTTPAAPPTPAPVMNQTVDKAAQAQVLFGVKSSMDQAMADRVAKMLAKTKA